MCPLGETAESYTRHRGTKGETNTTRRQTGFSYFSYWLHYSEKEGGAPHQLDTLVSRTVTYSDIYKRKK